MTRLNNNRVIPNREILVRFFSNIKISTEHFYKGEPCWESTYKLNDAGYASIEFQCFRYKKHRLAYQMFVDAIPDGLVIDHLCRIHHCCNPVHLEPVTNKINILRGMSWSAVNAKKTHCPYGHSFTSVSAKGYRVCGECNKLHLRRLYKKRSELPYDHPIRVQIRAKRHLEYEKTKEHQKLRRQERRVQLRNANA